LLLEKKKKKEKNPAIYKISFGNFNACLTYPHKLTRSDLINPGESVPHFLKWIPL